MVAALRASSLRQQVLANNVANVDTPFFQRSDVQFQQVLQQRMTFQGYRTDSRHLAIGAEDAQPPYRVVQDETGLMSNHANNVDLEFEMEQMAQNSLWYSALVQQMNLQLDKYRKVVEGVR